MRRRLWFGAVALLAGLLPLVAVAGDGRIEINQAAVEAAGGFPFTILQSGSYVLTSDLLVGPDVNGIEIGSDDVAIDLNGFAIRGPATCTQSACTSGLAGGVVKIGNLGANNGATVQNGIVSGFAGTCVGVGEQSHVENLRISECGRHGIVAFPHSVVLGNRVRETGQNGLSLAEGTTFAHNTVATANLSDSFPEFDYAAVSGGKATAGNSCDDGSCSAFSKRRFYLTEDAVLGSQPLTACDRGFHMASIFELMHLSNFEYDMNHGFTTNDSGSGPPDFPGWARTGGGQSFQSCDDLSTPWASNSGTGMIAEPEPVNPTEGSGRPGWNTRGESCGSQFRVWCIED